MKKRNKIAILGMISALCLTAGALSVTALPAQANAVDTSARFYMHDGASVSKADEYGGIRWTTTVEWNYQPYIANEEYTFGTFVMPTSVYNQAKLTGAEIHGVTGKIDIPYRTFKPTTVDETGVTFHTAVRYDDIVEDYKAHNPQTDKTDEEILQAAYKLQLTAISYAYEAKTDTYYYAEASDVSRSARQVANASLLGGEITDQTVSSAVKARVESYVGTRYVGTRSSGYLDLTEIKNGKEQTLTVQTGDDNMNAIPYDNVEEVVVGAKKVGKNINATTNQIIINGAPANCTTYENGEYAYVSLFTADAIYSIPAIAADGVIGTYDELNAISSTKTAFTGYYIMSNNIDCWGEDADEDEKVDDSEKLILGANSQPASTVGLQNAIFDGQGYTINNFRTYFGVFSAIGAGSVVRNVGISGKIDGSSSVASLVARHLQESTLENVYVKLTGWSSSGAGSPVAATLSNSTLKNCVVETVTLASVKYNKNNSTYHTNAMASISAYSSMGDFRTNTFTDCYVVSGMPLNMSVARSAGGSYRGQTNVYTIQQTFTAHNGKVYGTGEANGNGVYGYVEGLNTIVDTKAESEIQADEQYLKDNLGQTTNADGTKNRPVTMTHYNSSSAIKDPATGVTFNLTLQANVKTTKNIYKTGRSAEEQAYRYFDYTAYAQIGNGDGNTIKRYDNKAAMQADEDNNSNLSDFSSKYWTNSSGYLKWKTA